MFHVNVTNNFICDLVINEKTLVGKGDKGSTGRVGGTQTIQVPHMGTILVIDLGHDKVPGYTLKESWGVLLRYEALELYYRYEGDGEINLTVDRFGNVDINSVQGSALLISLPDLSYQGHST